MVNYRSFAAVLSLSQSILAHADCMTYSTATITDCGHVPTPKPINNQGPDGVVTVTMPECPDCKCECAYTKTYTTAYEAFCSTGVAKVTYTVEEIYKGMSTSPVFATPTGSPQGFTTTVATCTTCGSVPIVKTLTYPSNSHASVPTPGPAQSETHDQGGSCSGPGCQPVIGAGSRLESLSSAFLVVLAAAIMV